MKLKDTKIITIVLTLILTSTVLMATIPGTVAQTTMQVKSNTYLTVSPNPIGVDQTVNVMFWLDNTPPQFNSGFYYGWNYTLTITNPDGTAKTEGPFMSDPVGGCSYRFVPTMIGTYKFQAAFLGATLNITSGRFPHGVYDWQESQSRTIDLTVQTESIEAWPEVPLPTGYWSYPISAENRDWHILAGNWVTGRESPAYFTQAPDAPHILWTKELTFGGISGDYGWGVNWYTGLLYENKFSKRFIIGNRLYYNLWTGPGMFARNIPQGVVCVDMETGEEIWRNEDMTQMTAAQVLRFESGFQSGTTAYIWTDIGDDWQVYDAYTGTLLTTFENASGSISPTLGPNGEFLIYSLSGSQNTLRIWNSTKAIIPNDPRDTSATYKPWVTSIRDWSDGIQLDISVPDVPGSQSLQIRDYNAGVLVAQAVITGYGISPTFVHVGYDAITGQQLWVKNWTNVGWGAGGPTSAGLLTFTKASGEDSYAFFEKETMQWHVVDIHTGNEKWVTEPLNTFTDTDFSVYDWSGQIAYGKLIVDGYSGCVIAFDLETGDHLWTFSQGSSGMMTPYGSWPSFGGVTIADDKVYFGVTEHTPNSPMLRGYSLLCIDIESGELIWKMPSFFASITIAGGKLVGYNGYDNQIYCYGLGQSGISVTAPKVEIVQGQSIVIEGSVVDQSPGTKDTPAISDEDMGSWMEYMYMNKPIPTDAIGVEVTIDVVDSNGNYRNIGTVTSDISGMYSLVWEPDITGKYTIIATFAGSESYGSSFAETSIFVKEAPQPTAPPEATPGPMTDTYLTGSTIAILAGIAIAVFLILRKK